jgi:hypothetical protein
MENFLDYFNIINTLIAAPIFGVIGGLVTWRFKMRKVKREDIKDERDSIKLLMQELDDLTNDLIDGKIAGIKQKEIIIELEAKMTRIREHCKACYDELFGDKK